MADSTGFDIIATFQDSFLASVSAGMLEDNGIFVIVDDPNMRRCYFGADIWCPITLSVPKNQVEEALRLLREHKDITQ